MAELSDFKLGCDVFGSDGKPAGRLVSVLVESDGFDPKAIVVRDETTLAGRLIAGEKYLITDEVVIPISEVESAGPDRVVLSIDSDAVQRQKPYLSYRLKALTPGQALLQELEMLGGGLGLPPMDQFADKPSDQVEIDHNEKVMLRDTGRCLGRIHDVLYDQGELAGLVIKPDGFFKHDVVLPIRFISRADDMALFADIREEDLKNLKPVSDC